MIRGWIGWILTSDRHAPNSSNRKTAQPTFAFPTPPHKKTSSTMAAATNHTDQSIIKTGSYTYCSARTRIYRYEVRISETSWWEDSSAPFFERIPSSTTKTTKKTTINQHNQLEDVPAEAAGKRTYKKLVLHHHLS